jgi:hypothetical protein
MAAVNAFNTALTRCGFNPDTTAAIVDEGFDTLDTLATVDEDDIDSMIKNVRETRRALGANAQGNVTFPFLAIKRFKAMRNWATELVRTQRPLNVGLFTGALINNAVARFALERLRADTQEDEVPDKPSELLDLAKWETFWERWKTYLSRIRGAAKCPLSYIIRGHDEVTDNHHAVIYQDHDTQLVATTALEGDWFSLDNHRVYDEFKALVLKGPGWSFIKTFDRLKDGGNAVLTLRRQCEGTSVIQTRKASTYAKIALAKYSGQRRNFTFDQYVEIHQAAYNTLAELDEAVSETKKVADFLAGMSDTRLATAKDLILGDTAKLGDFEACQQYLKTIVYNKAMQDTHARNVSGLLGGNDKDGKQQGKRKRGAGADKNKLATRSYTREEWQKLSMEQREKISALRAAKRNGVEDKRNASSATQGNGEVPQVNGAGKPSQSN